MHIDDISVLEKHLGYVFKDKNLLKRALTHSSYANEQKINKIGHYERLEFLGDAVLELVSSDFFYNRYPEMPEGQLTKMRSSYVCEPALAFDAKEIELEKFIRLGKGEERTGGRTRDSIISDVCEAVIGAIYLDSGLQEAHDFIYKFVLNDLDNKKLFFDSKSILQEKVQAMSHGDIVYKLIGEEGPDHDKSFIVEAYVNDTAYGQGIGKTKKAAEQKAAYETLKMLKESEK